MYDFYVVRQYRSVSHRHTEWWWFFSLPYEFSVWWKPDGKKTMGQFLEEQIKKVQEFRRAYPINPTPNSSGTHF